MAGNIFKRKPTTSGGTDLKRLSEVRETERDTFELFQ